MNRTRGLAVMSIVLAVAGGCARSDATASDDGGAAGLHSAWSMPAAATVTMVDDVVVAHRDDKLWGLNRADGAELWRMPYPDRATVTVAGGLLVTSANARGPISVIDTSSGRTLWTAPAPVFAIPRDDALYLDTCPDRNDQVTGCTVSKRRLADGETLWTAPDAPYTLMDDRIGAGGTSAYLPVIIRTEGAVDERGNPQPLHALADAATGRLTAGRLPMTSWHAVAAGDTLVVSDHSHEDCAVALAAVDGPTGASAWTATVHSGRVQDGGCRLWLGSPADDLAFLGSGSDLAAVSATGGPTLIDLETGRTRWSAAGKGVPIAADAHAVLARDLGDAGALALYDMADGRRRWTAPDPGLDDTTDQWTAIVAGRLTVVSGAGPVVLVYDSTTGTELARRPGLVAGAGDGWVAITSTETTLLTF
ncbi:outer membrane protein assembly factor BamB family protein [Catenuloplanes japonicus]|uniref:outer membrane protein assembly factor BamB family protein n=1 Tax=Catenuloplanes japonicus TaxID=33876 RepID=UPI0005250DCD|nr:PQQ-binding-like beta-propeller repeat protein [Catenuloplanes japonicus]